MDRSLSVIVINPPSLRERESARASISFLALKTLMNTGMYSLNLGIKVSKGKKETESGLEAASF